MAGARSSDSGSGSSGPARIFATCDIGREALDLLRRDGHELEVWPEDEAPPPAEIRLRLEDGIDALVTTLRDRIDRQLLEVGAGRLAIVSQDAVGLDNIDLAAATELGIPVAHTPEVLTAAVAELTILLLGAAVRRLEPSERLVREGRWGSWHPSKPFLGTELAGKTLAIVGVGRIGKAVAARALGMDLDLLLCGRGKPDRPFVDGLERLAEVRADLGLGRRACRIRWVELDEALEAADIVSLHVPLIEPGESDRPTRHLIDANALARMKPSAWLVNTSRGPVVDEEALVEALRSNRIAGAALDVFEEEPLPPSSPLLDEELRDRVRVAHHFGSGTRETRLSTDPAIGMAGRCVDAVRRVLRGEDPRQIAWVANRAELG